MLDWRRSFLLVLAIFVAGVRPAEAWWRFLEHMSGPGWYDGITIDWKIRCYFPPLPTPNPKASKSEVEKYIEQFQELASLETLRPLATQHGLTESLDQKIQNAPPPPGPAVSFPCGVTNTSGDRTRTRRGAIGVSGGLMWSTINRLRYENEGDLEDRQVWIATFGTFTDWSVTRDRLSSWKVLNNIEVGGSAEAFMFFGRTTRQMWRLAIEPRITATIWTARYQGTDRPVFHLKVRYGWLKLLKDSFDGSDFGALPGPLEDDGFIRSVRIVVDIECFPWRTGKAGCAG